MQTQRAAKIALPDAAIDALADGVKGFRAALLVLEPWLETVPPGLAANHLRRQIGIWRGVVTHAEQQVLAHGEK